MMIIFLFLFIFILGICIGSFLNVLIDRLPRDRSIWGRSKCDSCKRKIAWYDLVPLLSFYLLKRRCRYCKHELSWQYPVVEMVTGILFVVSFVSIVKTNDINVYIASTLITFTITSGLIVIFFCDLKYRIIPDQILLLILTSTLFDRLIIEPTNMIPYISSALALFGIFLGLVLVTKGKGMGMGDVKYAFVMGLLLGYPTSIVAFYIAFLTGAGLSLILIVAGRKRFGQTIAFGPFLVVGTVVSQIWGSDLWIYFLSKLGLS